HAPALLSVGASMEITSKSFTIHTYDARHAGALSPPRLLEYLLEAAVISADSLGFGVADLQKEGLTWVLGRIKVVLDRELAAGDEIEVQTWPSGLDRAVAMREFVVRRDGQVVGRSTSRWFVLDLETRLAVRPQKVFPERLQPLSEHQLKLSRVLPSLPNPPVAVRQFEVRRSDIDFNQHVTAASYLSWALEALPWPRLNGQRLSSFDIQFVEECRLGESVQVEFADGPDADMLVRITRLGDSRELARMTTRWIDCVSTPALSSETGTGRE
ncbi:MAG TPA: acyl-ACP thioesterase domain-containing protein, partial [Polyangiaceae bacterium]|nr:acyl-ACP thioesterase domain-containing protein [Polyangiaceae bacterium]